MGIRHSSRTERWASRLLAVGAALALGSVALVALAATTPIDPKRPAGANAAPQTIAPIVTSSANVQSLLARLAGNILIRPAQVQAAAKSDGTAERLLKKLQLQGVVQVSGELVAYIQVDDGTKAVRSLRKGQTILDFVVENVEAGKVTLSLQGVVVVLGQG